MTDVAPPSPVSGTHVRESRDFWESLDTGDGEFGDQVGYGRRQWAAEPNWGDWSVPESQLHLLPADVTDLAVVELGCGTGYLSAWLVRRGARPVALDASARQLAIVRTLQAEFELTFPLVLGDAERVPCRDASFDLAISEYGAGTWCDPYRWIPEAARLLRPGGRLIFLTGTPLLALCLADDGQAAGESLRRDYFDLGRLRWPQAGTTEFQLPYGEWIRLLRRTGFEIEDLTEIRAPADGRSPWPFVDLSWARRWPSEQVWTVRRVASGSS